MKEIKQKELDDFVRKITRLEPVEFLGVATIFGIDLKKDNLSDKKDTLRPVDKIVEDIVNRYATLNRKKRREIQKILEAATRRSKDKNGD